MGVSEEILHSCSGVDKKLSTTSSRTVDGKKVDVYDFFKTGEIKINGDFYIEITATATKGTIAKVVGIEVETYHDRYSSMNDHYIGNNEIVTYDATLIYEVEGRKQLGRIKDGYTKLLVGPQETKYVRNVKQHEKVEVKNPVNKFKQEMQRGDWVVGVKQHGKGLGIGRITRWTNHNVWAVTGDDLDDKSKEFMFAGIKETFTMPDDKHVQLLTMAVLKGWDGR
jgi:hypothetical protein